jgi:hypothetical protein
LMPPPSLLSKASISFAVAVVGIFNLLGIITNSLDAAKSVASVKSAICIKGGICGGSGSYFGTIMLCSCNGLIFP